MSGPYDRPDDPEDVTLWAGRLRPWPASPVSSPAGDDEEPDGDADATVIARRGVGRRGTEGTGGAVDDEAALEDTVIVSRDRADESAVDDTVIVPRERGDDTVVVRRDRPVDRIVAEIDEGDDRPSTVSVPPLGEDDTAPGRRAPHDETVPSPRKRSSSGDPGADTDTERDTTVRSPRAGGRAERPEQIVDDTTTAAQRATGLAESLPATAPGRRRAPRDESDRDGSAGAAAGTGTAPRGDARARAARIPGTDIPEAYGPRGDAAVRVQRTAPAPRGEPEHDAALVRAKAPRRGAAAPLIIGGTTVVVLAGVLAALLLLVR